MKIRFILLDTTHPGNVGAAARAIKTMGFSELALVNPKRFPSADATARAAGADDVLADALCVDNLDEALHGCRFMLGASARRRHLEMPLYDARQAALQVCHQAPHVPVGILFGTERAGLSNAALARCQALLHIPTNPAFGSLNLAAAVQIVAYELRAAMSTPQSEAAQGGGHKLHTPTSAERMQGFFEHLRATLEPLKFYNHKQSRTMDLRLRRLFNRAQPSDEEINILRGMLSAIQRGTCDVE